MEYVLALARVLTLPTTITPLVWQRALKVEKGKDGNRLRATQIFPTFQVCLLERKMITRRCSSCILWCGFFADNVDNKD